MEFLHYIDVYIIKSLPVLEVMGGATAQSFAFFDTYVIY